MSKYIINQEADIVQLKTDKVKLVRGDILVHKPFEFSEIQGKIKEHYSNEVLLFPAMAGTDVYTINGYNTSVVSAPLPAGTPL